MTKIPRTIDDLRGVSSKSQEPKKQRIDQLNRATETAPIPKEKPKIPDPDSPFSLTLVNRHLFTCSFCSKLLTNPVLQCTAEEHILCSICAPELEDDRCRLCSAKTFKRHDLIRNLLDSFQVSCQNLDFGCQEKAMSLGEKRSHEEGCVFVPCSCPLCNFVAPVGQLASHFAGRHPESYSAFGSKLVKIFTYDTSFTITLANINEFAVFREEKDGDLFVGFNEVREIGNAVSVRRVGPIRPPFPGREYFYEIELRQQLFGWGHDKMKDNMSLKLMSPMISVRSRLENPPSASNFLLVPKRLSFDDSLDDLELTIRIWWQNVK